MLMLSALKPLEAQGLNHKVIFRVTGILEAYFEKGANRAESEAAERKVMEGTIQPLVNQAAQQLTLAFNLAFGAEPGQLRVAPPDVAPVSPGEREAINQQRLRRGVPPAVLMEEAGEEVPQSYEDDLSAPHLPSTLAPIGTQTFL